ncbi:membrane dipeptidase-domain-containing protein [Mariannaea sp. PMI_226]|nr:membrane dipeptidase-domain-containing protein [Mariannaea sp. PMI_226]
MGRSKPILPITKQKGSSGGAGHDEHTSSSKLSPRKVFLVVFFSFLGLSLLHWPVSQCYNCIIKHGQDHVQQHLSPEERARNILASTPLIDGHVDLPVLIRYLYGNHINNEDFSKPFEQGELPGQVDLQRLRAGQSGGAFWSLYAPCPGNGTDFSDENYAASVQFTLNQIDVMTRLQEAYPNDFSKQVDSSNALEAFKQGKLISPHGIEGLHQIGNSVANLRKFHQLGTRYATLTHNCHNKFADAAILESPFRKAEPLWGGVSPLGRQLIHEMNRIGMIVDLSHVSEDTMVDVLGGNDEWPGSKAPIMFSHSSAYSICPHPRNVKDHVLELVKNRNSIVMVNISPDFISCIDNGNENGIPDFDPNNSTLAQVVRHILHIGNLIGFEHVGIGSDFDGIASVPEGLEDVSKYPELVAELLRNGVSDVDVAKIVGGNILRVWKDVDAVAAKLQADGELPMEDDLPGLLDETIQGWAKSN